MINKDIMSKLDLTVVISLVIGISYGFTYIYYSGKFAYLNIPMEFIEVNIKETFYTMLILAPLIFNVIFTLVSQLKVKFSEEEKDNGSITYKEISKELDQTDKDLKSIEKEIIDKEKSINEMNSEAESVLKSLHTMEKEIRDSSYKKEEITETVNEIAMLRERAKGSLINGSKIETNIKRQKEQIALGYERTNNSKRKIRIDRLKMITFYFAAIVIIIMICTFFIHTGLKLYAYLILGMLTMTIINKWLVNREKYLIISLLLILFFIVCAYIMGYNASITKEKYIIFEKNDVDYVVLTLYDDKFLYAPIDKSTNNYEGDFNFVESSQLTNFSFCKIGKISILNRDVINK